MPVTGFPGHNAKDSPPRHPRGERKCQSCGAVEPERRAVNGSGIIYCGHCRPDAWESEDASAAEALAGSR